MSPTCRLASLSELVIFNNVVRIRDSLSDTEYFVFLQELSDICSMLASSLIKLITSLEQFSMCCEVTMK